MSYPIRAEFYSCLESILMTQAKKLVDDIAKHQQVDSKDLWAHIKTQVSIGLLDTELDDIQPLYCAHPFITDGAMRTRCRAPCLTGFDACPRHINQPIPKEKQTSFASVHRIVDYNGSSYFVNEQGIAMDKNGVPRGELKEDNLLVLFEKIDKPTSWSPP